MAQRIICDGCGESWKMEENNKKIFTLHIGRRGTDIEDWKGELCGPCRKKVGKMLAELDLREEA